MKILKSFIRVLLVFLLLLVFGVVLLTRWPTDPPPSPPPAFAPRAKPAAPLPNLKIEVLETGYSLIPEGLVVQGGSFLKGKRYLHAAILIQHPKGKILFDGGVGKRIWEEMEKIPGLNRFMLKNLSTHVLNQPLGLHASLKNLNAETDFFILSHGHWDHLSGFLDFPKIPVRILPEEWEFSQSLSDPVSHGIFPDQWSGIKNRILPVELQERPYENFPKSLDLFGDGSLVVVPLPGHTPGSLGLFVNLPDGNRFFLVGDAVHGINPDGSPEARTFFMELFSDNDRAQARQTRQRLIELISHSNEVQLVPTHEPDLLQKYLQKSAAARL